MLKYKLLPAHIEAVFIHNILKLFAHVFDKYEQADRYQDALQLCDLVIEKLNESVKSGELEVQERASTSLVIVQIAKGAVEESKYWLMKF